MLAILGFLTVFGMLLLVMSKKASPAVALIGVPVVTGVAASFFITGKTGVVDPAVNILELGKMISGGLGSVASTGVMFMFSMIFFGILTDAGTFRPVIRGILGIIKVDPVKIALGTAVLTMIVHLDGSGAVTFLICVPALLPVYDAVGMRRSTLATIVALAAGTMNMVPWGGPTIRAATALEINVMEFFAPVIPAMFSGMLAVLFISFLLGGAEKKRLGAGALSALTRADDALTEEKAALLRPRLFPVNALLVVLTIIGLIAGGRYGFSPVAVFMVAFVLAMVINYPSLAMQQERADAHAKSAVMISSVLFAAGAFTGIMKGTGMIAAMAGLLVAVIPESLGRVFPVIMGILAMPASLLFDPDSFYFGVLPILGNAAAGFGVEAVNVGRAAILGQMTTGFPVSPLTPPTFLLVGLTGVDLFEHQKKTVPLALGVTLVMLAVSIATGAVKI